MEAAHGPDAVHAQYADTPDLLSQTTGPYLVIKSHHGSDAMDDFLKTRRAPLFLSIRDPRDAALSMARRFNVPLQRTAGWLLNDCARLAKQAMSCTALLRYETRFFDDAGTIPALAEQLGLALPRETLNAIFARYRTEAVRQFAQSLSQLPTERLTTVGAFQMDQVTQILSSHIGDSRSGKWRELPAPAPERLTALYASFLRQFEYPMEME